MPTTTSSPLPSTATPAASSTTVPPDPRPHAKPADGGDGPLESIGKAISAPLRDDPEEDPDLKPGVKPIPYEDDD